MPLKIVRVLTSFLFIILITFTLLAQTPTSVDVMRDRISRAKAHLVVKNYSAAIYELENIRRETNDRTIHRVVNVLLMHSYLEQGDYKRTQQFLLELYKSKKPNAATDYLAVAGQVVSGAKTQFKRYQALGLSVSDQKLPVAAADLDNMRKTLEMVVTHSKALGKDKKLTANSLALLEATANARIDLARDAYDAKRWENEVSDTRERLANSGSKVINVVSDSTINAPDVSIVNASKVADEPIDTGGTNVAKPSDSSITPENADSLEEKAIESPPRTIKKSSDDNLDDNKVAKLEKPNRTVKKTSPLKRPVRIIRSAKRASDDAKISDNLRKSNSSKNAKPKSFADNTTAKKLTKSKVALETKKVEYDSPLHVGALIGYATKRVTPIYPRQARNMHMTGIVKVDIVVDEKGRVTKVENTNGPSLLKQAARIAAAKWRFRPFIRDGQPVKATGFVRFNFRL